ncbi:diphthine synthase [Nitrosopumilus sp. b1]|uniref:diphthine synthase n=1 Tax=Nitrosopumilus sp. b1 TaxID=2109907 RepID=UPI0015F547B8|nr:diphthine synthase [Nitrosopumilus sp. b1]KAF6243755.1 diphthine synthase [Nitrosopumilus sp. b1]
MLWFIGIGVSGLSSLSNETLDVLKKSDIVYLEAFTSPISKVELSKFKKKIKGEFKIAKRWMVEDGKEILKNSKKKKVSLISYGDPYIATTHIELRTRAINEKIKTYSIHAASSITSMVGECGLHYYKVGRIATIMSEAKSLTTPYYVTYKNLIEGNHTILLLEYNQDKDFFLKPNDALHDLLETEAEQIRKVISKSTFVIVASRIGFKTQKIICGSISKIQKVDFGKPPHTIIIPGNLHFTESDALKVLAKCLDEPISNSEKIKKIPTQMLEKYVPMVREAIKEIAPHYKDSKEYCEILENAELYVQDAEKFLEQGKDDVAILSIGYADGLVDALRIAKGMDPKM